MLPDASGLDVLRQIRQADGMSARYDPELPIIALSARAGDTDRVRGFDEGADDFVLKPVPYEELRARIAAVLRRSRNHDERPLRVGELVVDPAHWKVLVGERDVQLTKKEFSLLRMLASDPTRVFSKDELLKTVWGPKPPPGPARTVDSQMSRLRRKLDPDHTRYVVKLLGHRLPAGGGMAGRSSPCGPRARGGLD